MYKIYRGTAEHIEIELNGEAELFELKIESVLVEDDGYIMVLYRRMGPSEVMKDLKTWDRP